MSRRTFLALGEATAVATGLLVAEKAVLDAVPDEAGSTTRKSNVACPRGLVNDPYPGRYKHYVDTTGDGFCDYSVPG